MQIDNDVPIPEQPKRKRGRPPGSKNKSKDLDPFMYPAGTVEAPGTNISIPDFKPGEIETKVIEEVKKKRKWEQKSKKEPEYTIIGALNQGVAAVEFQEVKETKEEKEKTKQDMVEVDWWREKCKCTHSRTAHKTVGNGPCMLCECGGFSGN